MDVLQANNNGPARLLINRIGNRNHWLGLRLLLEHSRRDALGARIELTRADGSKLWRRVRTDGSFCSARDPRVTVGLGNNTTVRTLRVIWPDGSTEAWNDLSVDRYVTLQQGSSPSER
jgi:hypothetical protein